MPNSEVIEFECPRCLHNVRVEIDQAGQRIDCPGCEGALLVPNQSAGSDPFGDLFERETKSNSPDSVASSEIGFVDSPIEPADSGELEPLVIEGLDRVEDEKNDQLELIDDDPLSGLVVPESASSTPLDGKDPFEVDPEAPIKVDGLGDLFSHADVFGIQCRVCDTRIHVRPEQIGNDVECPVCYSQVKVEAPDLKTAQKWVKEGRGNFTTEPEVDELKLADPVERPKVEIDASYGLAPIDEDLLAPKPKAQPELDSSGPPSSSNVSNLAEDEIPALEILDDEEELDFPETSKQPAVPATRPKEVGAESKSRRERLEETQQRQIEKEQRANPARSFDHTGQKDFPDFQLGELASSAITMVTSPGVLLRATVAVGLMSFGAVMMEMMIPSFDSGVEEDSKSFMKELVRWFKWGLFGGVPYLMGTGVLWWASSYIFRDAALGNRKVNNWKNAGGNELMSTVLIFSFGFFLGGLPAFFMTLIILPLRILLGPLFLVGAWHNQSPFAVVSIDAFAKVSKNLNQWLQFYIFMLGLAFLGVVAGLIFWMRDLISVQLIAGLLSIVPVLIVVAVTLVFAAVCGWHVGRVMESLELKDDPTA